MEYTHQIKSDVLEELRNRNTQRFTEDLHHDVKISLCYRKINDAQQICFGLRVNVPPRYRKINVNYEVYIRQIHDDNGNLVNRNVRITGNSNYYDNDEGNYGQGPFNMDWGNFDMDQLLSDQYKNDDQEITFIYRINEFNTFPHPDFMIKRMYEQMFPDVVTNELDHCRQENLQLRQQLERNTARNQELQQEYSRKESEYQADLEHETQMNKRLHQENQILQQATTDLKKMVSDLQKEMTTLEDTLTTQEFDRVLEQFNPEKVSLKRPLEELKGIQNKVLQLQLLLSTAILNEEKCAVCQQKRRNYAFKPCGHLYFCDDCQQTKIPGNKCPTCQHPFLKAVKVVF